MAELISYLPDILRDIREFRLICAAGDREISELRGELSDLIADNFIQTLTERGCARWERMMGISPKATDDLAVRRFRILAKLNEELPFTFRGLKQQLTALCGEDGFSAEVDYGSYALKVLVALTAKGQLDEVSALLGRVVPANIAVTVSLKYNQHISLSAKTHAELSAYSHSQLRNEVLT